MISKEKITSLIEQRIEGTDVFLVKLSVSTSNAIKVVVDADSGVSIEKCIAISRHIEHNLNRDEEDFSLEVTSFGLGEALVLPRQYQKNLDRDVKIKLQSGKTLKGKLVQVEDDFLIVEQKLSKKDKQEGLSAQVELPYTDILETKVEVSFK